MGVYFRQYKEQDFEALEDIVRKTWHYDDLCSPKTAKQLARVFLTSCLTNYTFSRVAIVDGEVQGVILVKDAASHRPTFQSRWRQSMAILRLLLSAEGRKVMDIFGSVSRVDEELLKEAGTKYAGELALFALSESCRGQGIGKWLYEEGMRYLSYNGVDNFYLFTDTSCNYGFYEHQGLKRRVQRQKEVVVNGMKQGMNFFIYDNVQG